MTYQIIHCHLLSVLLNDVHTNAVFWCVCGGGGGGGGGGYFITVGAEVEWTDLGVTTLDKQYYG